MPRGRWIIVAAGLAATLVACGDDPFGSRDWEIDPDTAGIYALSRPELGLPSGFDFLEGRTIRIEAPTATGRWDLVLDSGDGGLVLLPPAALGVSSDARIGFLPDTAFDAVAAAPSDTVAFSGAAPLPVRTDGVYVVRTHRNPNFGGRCVQYGKFNALEVDEELGFLRFQWDVNPFCNDRALLPPDSN